MERNIADRILIRLTRVILTKKRIYPANKVNTFVALAQTFEYENSNNKKKK